MILDLTALCDGRALLHFLDSDKFNSKDEFVQNYKNLSSFNENEVLLHLIFHIHSSSSKQDSCVAILLLLYFYSLLIFIWSYGPTFCEEL